MTKVIVCSECKCSLTNCNDNELLNNSINCKNCIKENCCCISIHKNKLQKISSSFPSNLSLKSKSKLFFTITKDMYPAALGSTTTDDRYRDDTYRVQCIIRRT